MARVSVVMPCLNEEATVGKCVDKALLVFKEKSIDGEVIVVDNGSKDCSVEVAKEHGATVVIEGKRGYGNAYRTGFAKAVGDIIVMADSDDTYDLLEMPKLLDELDGADFVMGSRLRGEIKEGAMPWLHRHVGNPLLTRILNVLFKTKISDAHCGMRAFKKDIIEKLELQTTGMEFASEMIIKTSKLGINIKEVPISYSPRSGGEAKLVSFEDGWRHVRFMFLYKHAMLFLTPGALFFVLGLFMIFAVPSYRFHSMILGGFITILGFQIMALGIYSKVFAAIRGIEKPDGITNFFMRYNVLEYGMAVGVLVFLTGVWIGLDIITTWVKTGFGGLGEIQSAVIASTLAIVGIQMAFASTFVSVLLLGKKEG
jgi:glycosyltransferase involved in cell wall biosynthesis